jgi:DNA processing protein
MPFPIRALGRDEFPELLREVPDRPKKLSIRGQLPPRESMYLCVVGSRRTTPYGRRQCSNLIAGLSRAPVPIVIASGLAMGIDAEAHLAAMDAGLKTVAILPSGLDDRILYPHSNHALAQQILKKGGALISENPNDFVAMLHSFAQRNRIMAGMSKATLVVEAGEKSGTLITARLALDYNREVLCVPHDLGRESGLGVNRLLREGATLVRDSDDILDALGFPPDSRPEQMALPSDLTPAEAAILTALTEPMVRDELIEISELSAQEANIALSSLLIRGLILERLGKIERA